MTSISHRIDRFTQAEGRAPTAAEMIRFMHGNTYAHDPQESLEHAVEYYRKHITETETDPQIVCDYILNGARSVYAARRKSNTEQSYVDNFFSIVWDTLPRIYGHVSAQSQERLINLMFGRVVYIQHRNRKTTSS